MCLCLIDLYFDLVTSQYHLFLSILDFRRRRESLTLQLRAEFVFTCLTYICFRFALLWFCMDGFVFLNIAESRDRPISCDELLPTIEDDLAG
jgi:hypothetical protein